MMRRPPRPYNALREARKKLGLTQQELAGILDVARTTINTAESGMPKNWMILACLGLANLKMLDLRPKVITGSELKIQRERLGFSPDELAHRLGFVAQTIIAWERKSPPNWMYLALIGLAAQLFIA
ncbi:helix-turn-helix domain-containing protein [Pseudomonas guariconensis]|uniref:helix-turn-helix domain-containing protein n=1 Tax=Pseudomonas guariconensis TaxID=1288410 RepID=UPI003905D094